MKLRNKKTGEIGELHYEPNKKYHFTVVIEDSADMMIFKTLTELNEEWEDYYEEPKEYWYIDYEGGIMLGETDNSPAEKMMISMGNHFGSLEEAEKAVEKLRAWKRLKDKGVTFGNSLTMFDLNGCVGIRVYIPKGVSATDDFEIIFGGEE